MSRFTLICSLVVGLSSSASFISQANAQFAKAPPAVAMVDDTHVSMQAPHRDLRIAPRVAPSRVEVRAALATVRAKNVAAFRAYQLAGVFPSNTFKNVKANVWLDEDGHFCAAATIIKASGQDELVAKVAEQNNFIRLADVKQGPLMDWILTSGFTQDEIAMIQEPFMPVTPEPSLVAPQLVDSEMRKREDARLRAKYTVVDKQLAKQRSKSLDTAVERLMKNQELAWRLVDAQG